MPVGIAAVSPYVRGLDESLADRLERYQVQLETQPLAVATRRTYAGRLAGFLAWLAESTRNSAPAGRPLRLRARQARGGPAQPASGSPTTAWLAALTRCAH